MNRTLCLLLFMAVGCGSASTPQAGAPLGTPTTTAETTRSDAGPEPGWPRDCKDDYVFCIDENGLGMPDRRPPDDITTGRLQPGYPLTVMVVPQRALDHGALRLEANGVTASTVCLDSPPAADAGASDGSPPADAAATVSATHLAHEPAAQIHAPSLPDTGTFVVNYTRYENCGTSTVAVSRAISFNIGTRGYHFEAGLLFPVVFGGIRRVETPLLPNTLDSTIQTSQSIQAVPVSIALHYFPWGVEGGGTTSTFLREFCARRTEHGDHNLSLAECIAKDAFYWFVKPLAIEAGTTVVTNPFQEYFLGVAFGPVRGGTFSFGMAFVQGEFIPNTYTEGMLVPTNGKNFTPDTRYMIRPYIGLTLSPEIIGTVLDVLSAAKKIAPVGPSGQ